MEKRFQMSAEGIVISILVVLTSNEQEKLECKDLEKTITNIAKDLQVDWAVETSGNVCAATVSKTFGPVVGNAQIHEVELATTKFMLAVRQLEMPKMHPEEEEDCPVEDESDVVITFDAGNNGARIIKALREHMGLTVHAAQMRTMRGRIVCKHKDASLIMDNLDVAGAKNVHIDSRLTQHLDFCNNVLKDWNETEDMPGVMDARIMYGVKACPSVRFIGEEIPGDLLKCMFIAYANYFL